ncbi:Phosphotransferase involved in threonylcarbamoyladenosine t(6)A37 formation in tRNA [hydrothermal vent metagenome]|uniref:Phosphotransferase involved in threonylcarbamoyladenosine t(6)A37 formation in tRNA n=1 Tax=hydrothermal vent metagenome TaxID=652676 RepID=A0A3B1A2N4_9ZZZZ
MDNRLKNLGDWAKEIYAEDAIRISPASADASFRRYFRVEHQDGSHIIMDAPPDKEDSEPFVRISSYLASLALNVPQVVNSQDKQGFYLLTDLGSTQYLDFLTTDNVDRLYQDAMQALFVMQSRCKQPEARIPPYDEPLLLTEMGLFSEWYLGHELKASLSKRQLEIIQSSYQILANSALQQPNVFVHRDYHSRNLMFVESANPGILDFQDAVWGPVTYDLVSLLRDCYITWPQQKVESWMKKYYSWLCDDGLISDVSEIQFIRWFDLMGMQRHLKASGIFARLNHRDNKPGYMNDIPRTMNYLLSVASNYSEFDDFLSVMDELGIPEKLSLTPMENTW